jgi:hypothetical protein
LAEPKVAPSLIPLPPGVVSFPTASSSAPPSAPSGAPPEPVALELAPIEQAFSAAGTARFLDLSGRFTLEDRNAIAAGVTELSQKTNSKVLVLALPGKTDVNSFASIHADLKLQPRDVLLIFSAEKRHLHSQAIPKTTGNEILKDTNKDFYKSQTTGVLKMFDAIAVRLSSATTASTAAPATSAPPVGTRSKFQAEWVLFAVAFAVIVWALVRTSKKPVPKKPAAKS